MSCQNVYNVNCDNSFIFNLKFFVEGVEVQPEYVSIYLYKVIDIGKGRVSEKMVKVDYKFNGEIIINKNNINQFYPKYGSYTMRVEFKMFGRLPKGFEENLIVVG